MRENSSRLVWTPSDFLSLGGRTGVRKALQRLVDSKAIRRIDRGLYDLPRFNALTGQLNHPDYTAVIDAVARRDQIRLLVDGITAANQLGLTDAVPARVKVHTDARLRSIRLGRLTIDFKLTAPSKLYWAGRPAMRFVQALHWLADMLPSDNDSILKKLRSILADPLNGPAIRQDLTEGVHTLPHWMQDLVEDLLRDTPINTLSAATTTTTTTTTAPITDSGAKTTAKPSNKSTSKKALHAPNRRRVRKGS
jgi:hypothetical protein